MEGEKAETVTNFIFLGSKITVDSNCSNEIKRHFLLGRKAMTNLDSVLKTSLCRQSQYHQSYGFSSNHVQTWEMDHKGGWEPKNWCFQIVVLEKIFKSPSDCKEIKPVNPKGNQPWIFIGRTVAEAEAPILWPPDAKSQLIGKDPDAGKDSITDSMDTNLRKLSKLVEDRGSWWATDHEVTKSWTWLSKWSVISLIILNRNWKWHPNNWIKS